MSQYPEFNDWVDLDVDEGRPARSSKNVFRLVVRQTKVVNLGVINAWLNKKIDLSEAVLEALNFLDHLLREYPRTKFVSIKRSFFDQTGDYNELGQGVTAIKGVYQAIRPAIGRGLIVNIDVSNTAFWSRISVMGIAQAILNARDRQHLIQLLAAVSDGFGNLTESNGFYEVHKRVQNMVVSPNYEGCPVKNKTFKIKGLVNANARQYIIHLNDKATGEKKQITLANYFKQKYNIRLDYNDLPMVEMTKKDVVYPMEVLTVNGLQKYPYKLNELQTSAMIRYAVSRPVDRLASIRDSKNMLNHAKDPVLNTFGLIVDDNMIRTKARLLPSPDLQFGANQRLNPGTNGRWDLRGKKFYMPNKRPLEAWGVGVFPGRRNSISRAQVEHFCDAFMKGYTGHGGSVMNRPVIAELKDDIGEAVKKLYNMTGVKFQRDPQLLLFVLPDKNSFAYLRVKKSCDCRWGVPSQCMQSGHVMKANPQYVSNVLMKVNAKLGGATTRAITKVPEAKLRPQSMIIGADVTHPMLGVWTPSLAAVSVSADQFGSRYWGSCECNGDRIEIINRSNIETLFTPILKEWINTVGGGQPPDNIYYFRDGVSQGQFEQVLKQEVLSFKSVIMKLTEHDWNGKFTVVIANKRHHLRAFPKPTDRNSADRNGNPLPGTLIERDVTTPHEWDFILYSHIALQGTARPVHYHVILDQIGHKAHELQNMIYDHCYQYIRSTTSVSLHPAIYYAHLIATRARHHEDVPASSGPQSGPQVKMTNPKPPNRPRDPRLLPMHGTSNRLPFQMWYI